MVEINHVQLKGKGSFDSCVRPGMTFYNPRLALHSNTAPTAWKMKLGSQTIR
jgi:hypothetical protein